MFLSTTFAAQRYLLKRSEAFYCVKENFIVDHSSFFLRRCLQGIYKLKPCLCFFVYSSCSHGFIINLFCLFVFPDWRLRPADMGEISGAARNKGAFDLLFAPPFCFVFFYRLCSAYLKISPYSVFYLSSFFFLLLHLPLFLFVQFSLTMLFFSSVFLLTLSSLPSRLGVTCPSPLSSSPSLLLQYIFSSSSSLQFISLVSTQQGGRPSRCPTVHVHSPTL